MTDRDHKLAIEAAAKTLNDAIKAAHAHGLQVTLGIQEGQPNLRTGIAVRSVLTHTVRPVE